MFSNMMIRFSKTMIVGALAAIMMTPTVTSAAPKPESLGVFNKWVAYSYKNGKGPVCYVVSQPVDSNPKGLNRDPAFFLITHRPGDGVRNEANTIIGYPFKGGSTASISVDGASTFQFFTSGDGAWAGSKDVDAKVVNAMKAGSKLVVTGRSARGTKTTDQYSLSGVSAALKKINEACQ